MQSHPGVYLSFRKALIRAVVSCSPTPSDVRKHCPVSFKCIHAIFGWEQAPGLYRTTESFATPWRQSSPPQPTDPISWHPVTLHMFHRQVLLVCNLKVPEWSYVRECQMRPGKPPRPPRPRKELTQIAQRLSYQLAAARKSPEMYFRLSTLTGYSLRIIPATGRSYTLPSLKGHCWTTTKTSARRHASPHCRIPKHSTFRSLLLLPTKLTR